jgi:hypothetical protein
VPTQPVSFDPGEKPSTIKGLWLDYASKVRVPKGGNQWKETEQAFYSGAYAFFGAYSSAVDVFTEEEVMAWLTARKEECEERARERIRELGMKPGF